jgi:RimJ/RimL family protein N-acetyltransferase
MLSVGPADCGWWLLSPMKSVGPHSTAVRSPEEISGAGLRLRRWRTTDTPAVEAVRPDPFVSRWSNLTAESADEWIARQRDRTDGVSLGITTAREDIAVGKVALGHVDPNSATAELSYWLVPDAGSRGLATAASHTMSASKQELPRR